MYHQKTSANLISLTSDTDFVALVFNWMYLIQSNTQMLFSFIQIKAVLLYLNLHLLQTRTLSLFLRKHRSPLKQERRD